MKNTKSTFVSLLTIVLLSINFNVYAQSADKTNYVILLDLSVRILSPNQVELDKSTILNIYAQFVKDVKSQLIIKSNAKFSIHILPQQKSKLDIFKYNELLSIDISQLPISEKRKELDKFSIKLENVLSQLYHEAKFSNESSDYNGVDIWKFFNESLAYNLYREYQNTVVVITDGYFDFENNAYVKHYKNRYTSTRFLKNLKSNSWKSVAELNDYGLLKVQKRFPEAKIVVVGVSPKSQSLDEVEKIHYFWTKWISEMDLRIAIIDKSTTLQTKQQLVSVMHQKH